MGPDTHLNPSALWTQRQDPQQASRGLGEQRAKPEPTWDKAGGPVRAGIHDSVSNQTHGHESVTGGTAASARNVEPPQLGVINFDPSSKPTGGQGGGALRAIDQTFNVNPANGSCSLSIPMPLTKSPRPGSEQPALKLVYNSGSGNGPLGLGWAFAAGGSITRKTSRRIPDYCDSMRMNQERHDDGNSDIFVLDGRYDLVPVKETNDTQLGYDILYYRLRVEKPGYSPRVERWTSQTNPKRVFWRIVSEKNVASVYGRTESCQIFEEDGDQKRVFCWLMSETYDALGNAIQYRYKAEDDSCIDLSAPYEANRTSAVRGRERYLKSVRYGNQKPARRQHPHLSDDELEALGWCFEAILDYGEHDKKVPQCKEVCPWPVRQDIFSSARGGFEIRSYRLCRRLLMFHHFEEHLGISDYLVASLDLEYNESPTASFLTSVTQRGYIYDGKSHVYRSESLPSVSLTYSKLPEFSSLQVQSTKPACLQQLPASQPMAITSWIDLDGDGSVGLLVQMEGSWYYQRNENALRTHPRSIQSVDSDSSVSSSLSDGSLNQSDYEDSSQSGYSTSDEEFKPERDFGTVRQLPAIPNIQDYRNTSFVSLDNSGKKSIVMQGESGRDVAFYERQAGSAQGWSTQQMFPNTLNAQSWKKQLGRVDLTGTGRNDILFIEDDSTFSWHENQDKKGFGPLRRSRPIPDASTLTVGDGDYDRTARYFTDMTGDGLEDILEISHGRVSYWPNLGHGRFGPEVLMANPPLIPGGDQQFDSQRLLLLDADGIGTTDVAYLLPDGGALVYLNHCGNSWSEPFHLPQVPRIDNLARVFSVDLLGTGTRCLCWTVPEHGSCSSETVIRYINLSALGKPHLLTGIDNSLGRNTRIAYCASTRDSQMAEKSGTPWISNLPFPVQIVRKTVERDRFTHSVKTTKYVYRDGAFDRHEGEFCGFGRVETWQSEETRLYDSSESPNKTKYVGPVLYHRQWFHTGVEEAAVEPRDSFGGPPQIQTTLDLPLGKPFIAGCRALRGLQSRLEVYGLDKGQDSKSAVPYYVQDTAYAVEMVALSGPVLSAYAVCRTMTQQSLTTTYERIRANPRMSQALVLAWNEFGDATETVTIHYGASEAGASISTTADRTLQMQHHALLTKNTYTENHIDSLDEYCTSVLAASIVFRLEDFTAPGDQIIATLASIRAQVGQYSMHNRVSSTRILYFNEEMSGGLDKNRMPTTGPALVFQNFEEAVTDLQRQQSYGRSGLTPACRSIKDLVQLGGYLDLDDNGCWWRSSNRVYFSDTADDLPESNLAAARAGFFTPRRAVDAFGAISRVEMDALSLLVILSEDAEGKRTTVDIDYRTLSPSKIVDINENRTYIQRDAFARDSAVWMVEKKDGQIEDQPLNAEPFVCQDDTLVSQLIQFVEKPMESAAWELLGSATSRRLRTNTIHKTASGLIIPPLELELCRTHHGVEATGSLDQAPEVQIAATMTHHVTGKEPLQTASVRDWDPKHPQWVIAGVARRNLSEFSLRTYHPCLSTSPMLRTACKEFETASLTLTDALQRLVVTLYPDHTWSKTVHATWKSTHYNTGDMLHAIDPSTDPDIGKLFSALSLPAAFLPSWLETRKQSDVGSSDRLAAERAESTNPPGQNRVGIESHVDSRGRTILVANYHNADQFRSQEFQYDDHGRVTREVDSLGRIILYRLYDRPGNLLLSAEQDSGVKVSVYAADGLAILVEDARGVCQRLEYDALRRHRATWVMHAPGQPEILWDETEYAKDAKSAVTNSRGRVIAIRDQAGLRTFPKHDMRGNAIVEKTQLARVYNEAIDWNAGAGAHSSALDNSLVEPETYSSLTFVDLLNRPWLTSDALGHGTKRTFLLSSKDPIVVQMWSKAKDAVSWEPHVLESIYSADNLPTMVEYGNGCTTRSKYDSCSRKILEKQTRRATDGRIIEQLSYTYDHLRQLVYEHDAAQKEVYFRNNRVTPVREFWYDAWGRLKRSSGREIVNAGIGTTKSQSNVTEALAKLGYDGSGNGNNDQQVVNFVESYEYDGADNILSVRHMVSDAQTASWKRTYAYNEPSFTDPGRFGDRLSSTQMGGGVLDNYKYGLESEAHGASGYITAGSGFAKMEWDALGRLRSVSRTASGAEKTWFVYDSAGRRVRKLTDRRQTASDGGSDDDASNRIKIKETRYLAERADVIFKHTKGLDEVQLSRSNIHSCPHAIREEASPLVIIEQTKADGELLMRYALSVCLEVSGQGVIISYEEYSAFGSSVFAASIAIPREFRFAACRRDDETGFIHCGSRYLIPGLGRWLSPDPIGSAGGANVYAYCWNDPVNLDDRTGLVPPSPNSFAANVFPVTPKGRRDAVKKVVNWGASAFGLFVAQHFFNPDPNTQALERNMIGGAIGYVVGDLLVGNLVNYGLSLASPAFRLPEPTQPVNGAQAEPAAEQEENDLENPVANNQNEVPENQADVILDQIEMPNGQVLGNINDNANNEGLDDEGHITLPDVSENAGNVEANMANRIVPVSRHGYSINIDI